VFRRDIVCLRNISINTLHKGGDDDDNDNNDDDDNNNNNKMKMCILIGVIPANRNITLMGTDMKRKQRLL